MRLSNNLSISVIIPTYNHSNYIEESINSVLDQKGSWKLEIVVVNDGSTDNTKEVLKKFSDRIKYVEIPHSGNPAVVRNAGLKIATGHLIAFQDSDDIWTKDKLEKQVPLFGNITTVLVYSNAKVINTSGKVTKGEIVPSKNLSMGLKFETLLKDNVISTLTVIARKSAIEEIEGFDEINVVRVGEDYNLWLRMLAKFPNGFNYVNESLGLHRHHGSNTSNLSSLEVIADLIRVYDSVWDSNILSNKQKIELESQVTVMQQSWTRVSNLDKPAESPIISVVMSVYNAGVFLRPSIDSILNQTYTNFEFIIIDDGSRDGSRDVIKSYDDPRIRFISQLNRGLVASLNKGISLARGQFIARQDADDMSLPSRFEKLLTAITINERIGLVGGFFTYIDEQENKPTITITSPTKDLDIKRSFYIVNPFAHGGTLVRKAAIEQAGGYRDDYGPTEDFDLWRRIAENWEMLQLPESLYWYRISDKSISHQKQDSQHKFSDQIIGEQWRMPFFYKGFRTIVRDAHYYRSLHSPFAETIYHQYVNDQYVIAMELFARGKFKTGSITGLAAIRLDRSLIYKLWRPAIGGFLRKIGARRRKI